MVAETIFWLALLGLIYPYLIYPLILVARLAVHRPKATLGRNELSRPPTRPTVSVIIPVHNEEAVLEDKIRNSLALHYPEDRLEVVVACDGCTDRSVVIAKQFESEGVRVICSDIRRGKIFAMNLAARHAEGSVLLFTDARALLDPDALEQIAEQFADPTVGVVSGAIRIESSSDRRLGPTLQMYRRLENKIRTLESEIASSVGATGAMYAVRASLYGEIPEDTILDDLEVPLSLVVRGYRTVFDPSATCTLSPSASSEFERKRRTLAGNYQALWRQRAALNPWRSPVVFQILSHKVSRLIAPLFLALLWTASLMADSHVIDAAFVGQCAFYGTAVVGLALGRTGGRIARWQVPYSICLLQAANLYGLLTFSMGRMDVRWKKS